MGGRLMMASPSILAQAEAAEPVSLTAAGAAIMTLSVLLVLGLTTFCFWRILREPKPSEHHHAPLDIEMTDDDTRRRTRQ
jgi:heme/copper-type cytochrome/quinol oxidase subunit 2